MQPKLRLNEVAHALVRAVSRLVSTLLHASPSVAIRGDAARKRACATSLVSALALFITCGTALAQSKNANAQEGKRIFATNGCYQCHGYMGQGGAAGARIARTALNLAAFQRYVRSPTGNMPPYTAKVMTDEQLADVYAYLQSLPAPTPRKDIPLLNEN